MNEPAHRTSCCPSTATSSKRRSKCDTQGRPDYLLWGSMLTVIILYGLHVFFTDEISNTRWLNVLAMSVFELMNTMWSGIVLGVLMIAILSKIPREFIIAILGQGNGLKGILRATLGGVLLDLCNHGLLMVASKLYERGASAGQVIAFLVASPWNSFSLTIILVTLVGLPWTLGFILLSMIIAIITGMIFEALVKHGTLPENHNQIELPQDFQFWKEAKIQLTQTQFSRSFFIEMLKNGIRDSTMIIRWILFGIIITGLIRSFIDPEMLKSWFGPSFIGLSLTLVVATILEICSEGSTPIAADLMTRAKAPGNSFAFLMTGVATDYTEIMVLKDTTKSWKFALFLPLITVPQILVLSWIINQLQY